MRRPHKSCYVHIICIPKEMNEFMVIGVSSDGYCRVAFQVSFILFLISLYIVQNFTKNICYFYKQEGNQ